MVKSRKRRKLSARRGRPLKSGARYKNTGRLVRSDPKDPPIDPNPVVVDMRRSLVGSGDITKAENWQDLCLARGWITEERHRTLNAYTELMQRAGLNLPRLRTFSAERVKSFDHHDGDSRAMDRLRDIWDRLPQRRAQILFAATQAPPQWVTYLIEAKPIPSPFDLYQSNLFAALDLVGEVLDRPARRVA